MKKLLMSTVIAASSIFAITAGANAASPATDTATQSSTQKQHRAGAHNPYSQLNLTATQQAQIKAIMQEKYGAQKDKRGDYKAEREQMQKQIQTLTDSKTLNNTTLNRLADQEAAKTKQRFIERVQTQHAISQVLTPEQRTKMAQLKSERQAKGRQHLQNRKANSNYQKNM
ncbi:Spy/CpxP family protein refolding chaperone [Psychrobacter sp. GP33]|uniref:Spy/CpxP family protein refolding chaperone n=1 Tax=Psychrobacter sp. GP33 TaxID=2758709 RepID=UPI0015FAB9D3|nr:Spy/CpxP family protein refolding chaperone [Psychrobacter sp. GP33]